MMQPRRRRPLFMFGTQRRYGAGISLGLATQSAAPFDAEVSGGTSTGLATQSASPTDTTTPAGTSNGQATQSAAPTATGNTSGTGSGSAATSADSHTSENGAGTGSGAGGTSAVASAVGATAGSASGAAAVLASSSTVGNAAGLSTGVAQAVASALADLRAAGLSNGLAAAIAAMLAEADASGTSGGGSDAYLAGSDIVYQTGGTGDGRSTAFAQALSLCLAGGLAEGRSTANAAPAAVGDGRGVGNGQGSAQATTNALGAAVGVASGQGQTSVGVVLVTSDAAGTSNGLARALAAGLTQAFAGGVSTGSSDSWLIEVVVVVVGPFERNGQLIRSRFRDTVATPLSLATQYDNAPFVQPDTAAWCRLKVDVGRLIQRDFGKGNTYRKLGEFRAVLKSPVEDGDLILNQFTDAVSAAFRLVDASGISYGVPRVERRRRVGAWFEQEVVCPFLDDFNVPLPEGTPGAITGVVDLFEVVRTRFRDLVATPEALPTAYPNAPFDGPPDDGSWAALNVLCGDAEPAELGTIKTYRTPGVVMAKLYVPLEAGDGELRRLVDVVATNFRAVRDRGVLFRVPSAGEARAEGPYWAVTVQVPFLADLRAT